MKTGIHIDFTTLLGAVDALELIPETQKLPITFSHLLTLSQFFDSIVLHDHVYYENSDTPQHISCDKVIEDSLITKILEPNLLIAHQNPLVDDNFKYKGIEWAINKAKKVSSDSFAYSLLPRESHYRAMMYREGIEDKTNPYTEDIFDTARKEGDGKLAKKIDNTLRYLEMNNIGRMGLIVIFRLFHLDEWLSTEKGISYYPNFSRNPLIDETLIRPPKPRDFMIWSIEEINKKREEFITNLTEKGEVEDMVFKLSPIFLRCLKDAKHPRDLIDNAMNLRNDKLAKKIRKKHQEISGSSSLGEDKTILLRQELRSALKLFDEQNIEKELGTFAANGSLGLTGLRAGVSIKKTIKGNRKLSNVAFFMETLDSSLSMVNAMEAIEKVFGHVSMDDQWIMSAKDQRTAL